MGYECYEYGLSRVDWKLPKTKNDFLGDENAVEKKKNFATASTPLPPFMTMIMMIMMMMMNLCQD